MIPRTGEMLNNTPASGGPESVKTMSEGGIPLKVNLPRQGREMTREMRPESLVSDLIMSLELPPDGVIVLCDGVPVPLDTPLSEIKGNTVDVIDVASGG
ncbi:hypothetical protein B6U90_06030 [Thermoplasmatales archaeon ex4484_6]|nr:MAG: hypothetical protein B6U90_06030 [Thermoplasmatales archaeon ex4484_6]RLF68480.1 MAG: hypothetical protein DRN57_03875 [Thermoplasmata archaeon]